ncbi:MAG: TlpA family protein disulfide reductase [Thermoanaerobaculia bacterium]
MSRTELALVVLALALSGCGEAPAPESAAPAAATTTTAPAADAYQPVALTMDWDQVQLARVTFDQWQRELEAMRGRIVVVDNWATWCVPCLERFPAMVDMAAEWEPRGVTFVSLSLDGVDDPETIDQVRGFLEEQNARMPNYLMDEIIPDAFEKLDLLGIPAVYIYDAEGNRTHRLTGDDPNAQFTEADVEAALRELTAS